MEAHPLNNPVLNDELESNKNHAKFLLNQIRQIREKLEQTRKMRKTQNASRENNEEESQVIQQIQTELIGLIQDLDDTTKRIQVLIGLPNIDRTQIELNKLEMRKLGTNPILSKTYGILQKVPKLMVLGGQTIVISQSVQDENDETSEEIKSSSRDDSNESSGDSTYGEHHKTRKGRHLQNGDSKGPGPPEEERASEIKQIQLIEPKRINAKIAKMISLELENAIIKDTFERLIPAEQTASMLNFIPKGYPQNQDDVNVYIETIQKERNKIENLVDKARHEIRQQQRTIDLLSNGRLDPGYENKNQDRLHEQIAKKELNQISICNKEVKILQRRTTEQLNNIKREINDIKQKNKQTKSEHDNVNNEMNKLHELIDERREVKELKISVDTIQEELNSMKDQITNMNQEESNLREILDAQESKMAEDRKTLLLVEEKFEQEKLCIMKEEEKKMGIVKDFQENIKCARQEMENNCAFYRTLPFILAAYETQCAQVEETRYRVSQDIAFISQENTFYTEQMADLENRKEKEEAQLATSKEKQDKVSKLRDRFDMRSIEMKQLQKATLNLQNFFDKVQNRIDQKTAEIKPLRQTIESSREEFAINQMSLRESQKRKKEEYLREINDLEMRIAAQRGLMRAVENKCIVTERNEACYGK
ncbi:hypothetical protein WDU94_002576 [Cyamophila willieti]